MYVTHRESWQLAGEIVEALVEEGIVIRKIGGVDGVERIAGIIGRRDGEVWDDEGQAWEKIGKWRRVKYG